MRPQLLENLTGIPRVQLFCLYYYYYDYYYYDYYYYLHYYYYY